MTSTDKTFKSTLSTEGDSPQSELVSNYNETVNTLFCEEYNLNELSTERGLPDNILNRILDANPFASVIPEEYGGIGEDIGCFLSILEASSYHSLPLSLTLGINGALFLQPLAKYGNEHVKQEILDGFLNGRDMGGLMITEPDYGTDALNMKTSYRQNGEGYRLNGTKHWGGLTGMADWWLIAARQDKGDNGLARDVDFFICPGQSDDIEVTEYYENLGLYMIPYGRNEIDAHIPLNYKLEPPSTGISMMLDMLHRSRYEFPGMAMGYLKRLQDEVLAHCKERTIGSQSLIDYDQVQHRIEQIQAAYTICSAMCLHTTEHTSADNNLSKKTVVANTIKSLVTDLMQETAQSSMQLFGAKSYRLDHIVGRSLIDSRSFMIFEGSNDVLYDQVTTNMLKEMRRSDESTMSKFLQSDERTSRVVDRFDEVFDFQPTREMSQRKRIILGNALARLITLQFVHTLGDRGFSQDHINVATSVLNREIREYMDKIDHQQSTPLVREQTNDHWFEYRN
ncbi:MAG: acyl-CoA dehydrogenase family protein [bacterium]